MVQRTTERHCSVTLHFPLRRYSYSFCEETPLAADWLWTNSHVLQFCTRWANNLIISITFCIVWQNSLLSRSWICWLQDALVATTTLSCFFFCEYLKDSKCISVAFIRLCHCQGRGNNAVARITADVFVCDRKTRLKQGRHVKVVSWRISDYHGNIWSLCHDNVTLAVCSCRLLCTLFHIIS